MPNKEPVGVGRRVWAGKTGALGSGRNVVSREHEGRAWDKDDTLIRAATDRRRQATDGCGSDVFSDDGKITVLEFEDVRATK